MLENRVKNAPGSRQPGWEGWIEPAAAPSVECGRAWGRVAGGTQQVGGGQPGTSTVGGGPSDQTLGWNERVCASSPAASWTPRMGILQHLWWHKLWDGPDPGFSGGTGHSEQRGKHLLICSLQGPGG